MRKSIRLMGLAWTIKTLAICLACDVLRGLYWLAGEPELADELLAEERKLWS